MATPTTLESLDRLELEIDILENWLAKKEDELLKMRMEAIKESLIKPVENIEIGSWDCKDSPIGICFYDSMEDPVLDDCLICGEPHERK